MAKHWDVFLDSFVNIALPDDVDPSTVDGIQRLTEAALKEYVNRMVYTPDEMTFTWELYEEDN